MTNFIIGENDCPHDELKRNIHIRIGDTIEYISNNQEGYKKFQVIWDETTQQKTLDLISTCYQTFSDDDDLNKDDVKDDDEQSYVVLSQDSNYNVE
jgi:hypothetical protein